MSDSAKGSLSGYLFQLEKALLLLSNLTCVTDYISIEHVDDIATHNEDGEVLLTVQAKHSILTKGTAFEDTSYALWRTLQIWIQKFESNIFDEKTLFTCCTNVEIPSNSLLYSIKNNSFEDVISLIETLLLKQTEKLIKFNAGDKEGNALKKVISLIDFVLKNQSIFEKIKNNILIKDNECIKEEFLNRLYINSTYSVTQKDAVYHEFYGWINSSCVAKWRNNKEAKFTKKSFEEKHLRIFNNPSIINAVFRTKQTLRLLDDKEIQVRRNDLFVKQIEDICRRKDAKKRIIKEAIIDFIYSDIELTHIITKKGDYTESDFEEFLNQCFETWQACFDQKVIKEIDEYDEEERNALAIRIYDEIFNSIEIKFKHSISFNSTNSYVKNGNFLKLSNIPRIGWRPDWESKYNSNE